MCEHKEFKSSVKIDRFADRPEMLAEVRIRCAECDESMQFLGLPAGLAFRGAAVSPDGVEARLAILPRSAQTAPVQVRGKNNSYEVVTVKKHVI